jgi:tRNA threonylcarbamoyladenosine biosynthesis protein TsaE
MQALGREIGVAIDAAADGPFIVAFEGELGAGKTTLVGGILRAYGITGPVRSPTYTLIEPYETARRPVYHLDLYRLVDPGEVEPLGIRDLLAGSAVLLIEWPSKATGAIPAADLWVEIAYPPAGTAGREVRLTPHSPSGHNAVRHIVAAIPELRQLSS